jgi:hypothetical protein
MAYYYHDLPGFIFLTWVLLSFIVSAYSFVHFTVAIFNPVFTIYYFYLYIVNIPGLIMSKTGETGGNPVYTTYYGIDFRFPIGESAIFTASLFFFILLIPTRYILKI